VYHQIEIVFTLYNETEEIKGCVSYMVEFARKIRVFYLDHSSQRTSEQAHCGFEFVALCSGKLDSIEVSLNVTGLFAVPCNEADSVKSDL